MGAQEGHLPLRPTLNTAATTRYMPPSPPKETTVSTKKPTLENDGAQEATVGVVQEPEPTSPPTPPKDRRFWGKKAKDVGADQDPSQAQQAAPEEPFKAAEAAATIIGLQASNAELKQRLEDKEARLNATVAQYKEALDEFEGAKARLKRDVAKDVAQGKRAILVGLLEVIDNLERALGAAAPKDGDKDFQGFFEGVSMVRDQFVAKCAALGVTRAVSLGAPFNPLHCEAISTVPVADAAQHDTVVGVVREAYLMDGETLRHGIVAVGKHTP